MRIGLYNLKYPARKLIEWVLPWVRNVSPNTISWVMFPFGIAAALCSYYGFHSSYPSLFILAVVFTLFRMFFGTLDGLMAVHFKKESFRGELTNRLVPELCDTMYLLALTFALPSFYFLGTIAITIAWLTSFAGLLGLLVKKPIQSVGPVGQTDRLAAFMVFALLQYFSMKLHWPINFMFVFLLWSIFGGVATIFLRLWRNFRETQSS